MSPRGDQRIDSEIAGYRPISLLGSGGMSAVYLAEDERLGRKVALKLLAPELSEDERFRIRFLRESRLAASIDHSNIVPIYEAGEAEGALFIAMRRVEGTDLRKLLRREGPLEPARALTLLGQVADALDAAHEQGLVHRDVKPSNVLVARESGREHCYLSDFGLTKSSASLGDLSEAGHVLGTIDYVAPEQIEGAAVDGRADVYSLACVLFECLTGEVPFRRDSDLAVLWAHVQDAPPSVSERRSELTPALDPVIAKGMAKDRDKRYASCADLLAAAWRELTGDEAKVRRDLVVAGERGLRWWVPVAAAGVGLALLAAAGLAVILTRGAELRVPAPDTVARIDPSRNAFDRVFGLSAGADPQGIALGGGKLWVVNLTSKTLLELDPSSGQGRVLGTPSTPTGVTFAGGRVWITFGFSSDERRVGLVDPEDLVLEAAPFPVPDGSYPITVGAGSVWIADPLGSTVTRYEPVSEELDLLALPAASGPVDVRVSAAGSVWVAAGREPVVFLLDAAHLKRPPKTFGTRGDVPTALAVAADGSAWIASEQSDSVLAVTPTGMISVHRVLGDRCDGPTAIAATGEAVWVSCANSRRVVRLDPSDGSFVTAIPVGGAPGAMAVDESGAVWVAVQKASVG
jgi:streptogramin lyase